MGRLGYWPDLQVEDIDWLLSDGLARSEYDRRLVVNSALAIQLGAGSPDGVIERIRMAADADPIAIEAFESWMQAQQAPSEPEEDPELVEIQRRNAAAAEQRDHSWLELVQELRTDPIRLAALRVPSSPVNMDLVDLWQFLEGAGNRSKYEISTVNPLERMAGVEVAVAARDGFMAHWRKNSPLLESRRAADQRNTLRWVDIMGVEGITLETATVDQWPEKLTADDAKLAASYATLELNGFPSWLSSLAKAKPKEVVEVLLSEMRWEFSVVGQFEKDHIDRSRFKCHSGLACGTIIEWPVPRIERYAAYHYRERLSPIYRHLCLNLAIRWVHHQKFLRRQTLPLLPLDFTGRGSDQHFLELSFSGNALAQPIGGL
jgi:hypothetical protein